jgi:hypothetical protein
MARWVSFRTWGKLPWNFKVFPNLDILNLIYLLLSWSLLWSNLDNLVLSRLIMFLLFPISNVFEDHIFRLCRARALVLFLFDHSINLMTLDNMGCRRHVVIDFSALKAETAQWVLLWSLSAKGLLLLLLLLLLSLVHPERNICPFKHLIISLRGGVLYWISLNCREGMLIGPLPV